MAQPYMTSNFELTGPLSGLFGGIQQGQEEERQRLANVYQDMQNQRYGGMTPNEILKSNLEGALAKGKLEGGYVPEAVKAAIGEQQAKVQEFDLAKGINNIELARTALDAGMPPENVAQQFNVDLNTPFGQAYLKDPHGALDHVYDNMVKRRSDTVKQRQALELENLKGKFDLKKAGISAASQANAADKNLRGQMLQYSGQLRSELDNINNNITKIDSKEAEAAIIQDFMNRGNKNPTPQDIETKKSELRTALETRKKNLETELDDVRGQVRGKLGIKQQGTASNPIKLD